MSIIENTLSRKKNISPQYDFLWRVELPILRDPISANPRVPNIPPQSVTEDLPFFLRILPITSILQTGIAGANVGARITAPDPGPDLLDPLEISSRVYEVSIPFRSYSNEQGLYKTASKYYAGRRSIGTITLTVDEMEDGLTLSYFKYWMGLIENEDGTRNPPSLYKFPIKFLRMSATKLDLSAIRYVGCWPSEISPVNNSYDGNGVSQYSITLIVDDVEYIPIENYPALVAAVEEEILGANYMGVPFDPSKVPVEEKQNLIKRFFGNIFG